MNGRDLSKLNMFRAVLELCNKHRDIVSTNAAFAVANTSFSEKVAAIIDAATSQGQIITGITTDKNVDRDNLVQSAADLAGIIFAYAGRTKNNTLKEAVDISFADFDHFRGEVLLSNANNVYNLANENLAGLADADVSAASLAEYDDLIKKFTKSLPAPRTAVSEKGTHTGNVEDLMREATVFLKEQLDNLVVVFRKNYPDFISSYEKARIVINPSSAPKKDDSDKKGGTI